MIQKAWSKIHSIKQIILSKRNIMENRTCLSLTTVFSTLVVIFIMTGAFYFRNEVVVFDEGETFQSYTMEEEAETILKEVGIELGELDYYLFDGFNNSFGEIHVMRAIEATVIDGDTEHTVKAKKLENVDGIIAKAGITRRESDFLNYAPDYKCVGGEVITIDRGFNVNVLTDNKTFALTTLPDTVEGLLLKAGITLSKNDIVTPPRETDVKDGMEITIQRVKYKKRTINEEIPYKTIEKNSNLLAIGQSETATEGLNGKQQTTVIEKHIDGKMVSTKTIGKKIIKKAKDEVILKGTALATPYSKREFDEIVLKNGIPLNYEYVISGKSCAYTAGPNSGTASGRKLEVGTVAVNPNVIPYGSLLYIVTQDGTAVYGAAVAADTGAFAGSSVVVDLFMGLTGESYDTACNWGARYVDVYVVNTGKY